MGGGRKRNCKFVDFIIDSLEVPVPVRVDADAHAVAIVAAGLAPHAVCGPPAVSPTWHETTHSSISHDNRPQQERTCTRSHRR